jgi:predicted transcriptional regulator
MSVLGTRHRRPLAELCAGDLMTPNPLSVRSDAPVRQALEFLVTRGVSGAVVIDNAGHPVGVLTLTDLVIHDREKLPTDGASAADVMTPIVFSVRPETPAKDVVERMVDLNIHRVFVQDSTMVVIGVITALDVLRHIR